MLHDRYGLGDRNLLSPNFLNVEALEGGPRYVSSLEIVRLKTSSAIRVGAEWGQYQWVKRLV